jgi:KipI family sensor histidine kinase inhibitor
MISARAGVAKDRALHSDARCSGQSYHHQFWVRVPRRLLNDRFAVYSLPDMPSRVRRDAAIQAEFVPASDQSLLVLFGREVRLESHQNVVKLLTSLQTETIEGIRNLHPAYCSLLIKFDPVKLDHNELQSRLVPRLARLEEMLPPTPRKIEIPVCYDEEFGPDLKDVATMHGMTLAQAIELHSSPTYTVYFLGFAPGFGYLGGLPKALASPRLATPRAKVPQGSVGIGGNQTAIYPFATPGGWRLIGRTPLAMFRRERTPMSLLQIGDQVRFRAISKEEFAELGAT